MYNVDKVKAARILKMIIDSSEVSGDYTPDEFIRKIKHIECIVRGVKNGVMAYKTIDADYTSQKVFEILGGER